MQNGIAPSLLIFLITGFLGLARADECCQPDWVQDPANWSVDSPTAVFLTHFTKRLDKEELTRPAMQKLVALAKREDIPVVYLQESHHPAADYFYDDCEPTAYVESGVGQFSFKTGKVDHAIVAGGYYELCLNNTVRQLIENWSRHSNQQPTSQQSKPRKLKITYVLDATYAVLSDSHYTDTFDGKIQAWIKEQPCTTVLLSAGLKQIKNRQDATTLLSRRWNTVPSNYGLQYRFRNISQLVRDPAPNGSTLMIEYLPLDILEQDLTANKDHLAARVGKSHRPDIVD